MILVIRRAVGGSQLTILATLCIVKQRGTSSVSPEITKRANPMDMSRYKDLFISEAQEHLQVLNEAILELEREATNPEPLERIFRAAHTIKGMSATMGYSDMSHLAHETENLLDRLRRGAVAATPGLIDLLFECVDSLGAMLADITADRESQIDLPTLLDKIGSYEPPPARVERPAEALPVKGHLVEINVSLSEDCLLKGVRAFMVLERLRQQGRVVACSPPEEDLEREYFDLDFSVTVDTDSTPAQLEAAVRSISEIASVAAAAVGEAAPAPRAEEPPPVEKTSPPAAPQSATIVPQTTSIRVNVKHLDTIMNLIGELVISRSQIARSLEQNDLTLVQRALVSHNRIMSSLRDATLQMRMVPVSQVFNRFPRMVRDLLRAQGKEARLMIEGQEMKLDRTILEELADPLVHLLRNAVDHGLEPPDERQRRGKPRTGLIRLTARREQGMAIIEVSDDGRGLVRDRIIQTAIKKGVIEPDQAPELDEHQIYMLICHPGFSMAKEVTSVSGRGVGMDVVKRRVESLRGMLDISSREGQGTTFHLRIPLTLAIIQALLIGVGNETYAVPLNYIERTIEIEPATIKRFAHWQITFLDEMLPLFPLRDILRVPDGQNLPPSRHALIVRRGQQRIGLMVDALCGKEEIVIKSLPGLLKEIPGLSGATIMGDGQVVLILDIPNLIQDIK